MSEKILAAHHAAHHTVNSAKRVYSTFYDMSLFLSCSHKPLSGNKNVEKKRLFKQCRLDERNIMQVVWAFSLMKAFVAINGGFSGSQVFLQGLNG